MSHDPDPHAVAVAVTVDLIKRKNYLTNAVDVLLTEQGTALTRLGELVMRSANLDQLVRRNPELKGLARVAKLMSAAVTEARYLETQFSDARAEAIIALVKIEQGDSSAPE